MTTSTQHPLTAPEVGRRIGVDPTDVYELIFRGSLRGAPGADGRVYVVAEEVERFLREPPTSGAGA